MNFLLMGLPKSGKSTLFNSLTKSKKQEIYTESRLGTVKLPDQNLEKISQWYETEKKVYAEININDPETNLNFDSSKDFIEKRYIHEIQKFDGVILIIRAFKNDSVVHPYGDINYVNDLEQFMIESRLIDIQIIERRIENIKKKFKSLNKQEREKDEKNIKTLSEITSLIEKGESFISSSFSEQHKIIVKDTFLLAKAPLVVIVNTDEEYDLDNSQVRELKKLLNQDTRLLTIPLKFEEELSNMDQAEANKFRSDFNLDNDEIKDIFPEILSVTDSICFLTAGKKECRSWLLTSGSSAVEAAAKIHSDIARGFIRAEVIQHSDLLNYTNEKEAKDKGVIRREGKNYTIKTGDVVNFLFSV